MNQPKVVEFKSEEQPREPASEVVETGTELVVITPETRAVTFKEGGLDPIIDKIESMAESFVPDMSTERGRKEIASLAYKVACTKNAIDREGLALKKSITDQTKVIDAERAKAWARLEALQTKVRAPLTEWENAEKKRVEDHEAALSALMALGDMDGITTSSEAQERMSKLPGLFERDWQEFSSRANVAHELVTARLTNRSNDLKKAEEEAAAAAAAAAEVARKAQEEHDAKIAAEAAEKARKEAEDAAAIELAWSEAHRDNEEFDKLAAEKKAEQEREARELAEWSAMYSDALLENDRFDAKKKAEALRVSRHRERIAEMRAHLAGAGGLPSLELQSRIDRVKALAMNYDWQEFHQEAATVEIEVMGALITAKDARIEVEKQEEKARNDKAIQDAKDAEEDAQRLRAENIEHKRKINGEAKNGLIDIDHPALTEELAQTIIIAIAKGEVPHVSIKY